MLSVDVDDLKTHLPKVLQQVAKGNTVAITRQGNPFAKMVPTKPSEPSKKKVLRAIRQMEEFQRNGPTLGPGLTIKDLIEEGRR